MGIPCTILTFTNDDHKSVKRPARAPASDLQAVVIMSKISSSFDIQKEVFMTVMKCII